MGDGLAMTLLNNSYLPRVPKSLTAAEGVGGIVAVTGVAVDDDAAANTLTHSVTFLPSFIHSACVITITTPIV